MERIIDVTSARRQFGSLLDEVFHKGDVVTIRRKGKPLAKIVPIETCHKSVPDNDSITWEQKKMLEELNSLPKIELKDDPVKILRNMRKQKRIKASL